MKHEPIPAEARNVVAYIRANAKKPKRKPELYCKSYLRWGVSCPLGLCPAARCEAPSSWVDFNAWVPFSNVELKSFIRWWDRQTDARWAVDQVWPPGSKAKP